MIRGSADGACGAKRRRGPSAHASLRRRALLDAVAGVLAEHGLDTPLELIARRAGVEPDTLRRSFPNRIDLAVAALRQEVEDLADRTRSWGGEADVFLWFLEQLADLCVRHAEVSAALLSAAPWTLAPLRRTIVEAAGRALRDSQAEGLVRGDLTADDVLTIATLLGAGLSGDLDSRRAISLRTRSIILDGLKARSELAS